MVNQDGKCIFDVGQDLNASKNTPIYVYIHVYRGINMKKLYKGMHKGAYIYLQLAYTFKYMYTWLPLTIYTHIYSK